MSVFHLSFVVPELKQVRQFYTQVFNCPVGRDAGSWIDIQFFGHQLTIHQASASLRANPIDHFGPVLDKVAWQDALQRCRDHRVYFTMQPMVKNEGSVDESGKFIVADPADNAIEFKYYANFANTVMGAPV